MKKFILIICIFITNFASFAGDKYVNVSLVNQVNDNNCTYCVEYGQQIVDKYGIGIEVSINNYKELGYNLINTINLFDIDDFQFNYVIEAGVFQEDDDYYFDSLMGIECGYIITEDLNMSLTPQLLYDWYGNIKYNLTYDMFFIEVTTDFNYVEYLIGISYEF